MNWAETINLIRTSPSKEVMKVACPVCGGAIAIEIVLLESRSAIYVDCKRCGEGARSSGAEAPPDWVVELGKEIVTAPES